MTKRDLIPIYDGALQANRIGTIARNGLDFDIIRPGYDSQGRRRNGWTQIVYEGVPVYSVRIQTELPLVIQQFDTKMKTIIKDDKDLLKRAIAASQKDHKSKFKDGKTGEAPAPALTVDGREDGKNYAS